MTRYQQSSFQRMYLGDGASELRAYQQEELMSEQPQPKAYISTWTNADGAHVWQAGSQHGPMHAERSTEEGGEYLARESYARHRGQVAFGRSELPESPWVWDGDAGAFRP